jgi:hypothetical protein
VDVAAEQRARAVIFGDQLVAVVEELGGSGGAPGLEQPPERVVDERRILGPRGGDQPVLDVVDVAGRVRRIGRRGEVAVRIVAERRSAGGAILVEAVHRIGAVGGDRAGPRIAVVARGARGDLAGRIIAKPDDLVGGRPGEIVGEGLKPARGIVVVAARRAAAGQARAAAGSVVAEGHQRIGPVLAYPEEPAEPVIVVVEEVGVGMGDPDPAAVGVVEMPDGAARARHDEG